MRYQGTYMPATEGAGRYRYGENPRMGPMYGMSGTGATADITEPDQGQAPSIGKLALGLTLAALGVGFQAVVIGVSVYAGTRAAMKRRRK